MRYQMTTSKQLDAATYQDEVVCNAKVGHLTYTYQYNITKAPLHDVRVVKPCLMPLTVIVITKFVTRYR